MWIKSLWTALSTYSIIPVPQYEWDENANQYTLCFFPVVGVFCAAAQGLWFLLCAALSFGALFYAAVAAVLPLLITGGIHMDGYMDTVDALASWQPRERKLEIMKDSHCGSFAVIYCGIYLIVSVGVFSELYARHNVFPVLCGYILSRALSGLCAVNLPNARKSGMLHAVTANARRRNTNIALALTAVAACIGVILPHPAAGACGILFAALWVWFYRRLTAAQFGGVTGDTAGFFLQVCELLLSIGVLVGGAIL